MAGTVSEDSAEDFAVLVVHLLRHVQQYCVVDLLNVDPSDRKRVLTPHGKDLENKISRIEENTNLNHLTGVFTC